MMSQELERSIQEVWALFKETDKKFEETDEKFKETDERFKETDDKIERMAKTVEEVGRYVKEVSRNVGDLTSKWGKFVEGLVAPGAVRMFKEREIDVKWTSTRNKVQKDGQEMEIDIILEDDEYVVAIEVRSTLKVEDVNEHVEKLIRFHEFFPRFKEQKLIGAVAGVVIEEEADKYAYRKDLFVITQTGETVKILNDKKFKPKLW
jgi:hypothetical protein